MNTERKGHISEAAFSEDRREYFSFLKRHKNDHILDMQAANRNSTLNTTKPTCYSC
jgi:hypothetical protein